MAEVSFFWVDDPGDPINDAFVLPEPTFYASFFEALEEAEAAFVVGGSRPWIRADGVLFSPSQIAVLRRHVLRYEEHSDADRT